ncbi:aromatic ring-hydroxylating dioxygenase subunit alpha [Rhizorhabdus wittichii]|uniref:aromatic ring-hydroxylating dioxygenase subunit alpha n=1 Tax=Rhizorhabdus wittichii TaxID=160791 RepID=UPI0002DE0359|nr:aromatic ring-hydroxylating dioxygenase subunit alpha [Rhizorhabdus wittichii]
MTNDLYLRNAWYVAALAGEVEADLLRRLILGEPVLLFRDEQTGAPSALHDLCPHRFAPLSRGKRVDGGIQCGYHGLVFAPSGKCVLNPHGNGRILPTAAVRAFPVIERYGMIWIWMGEHDLADPSLIPDFSYLDAADQRTRGAGYLPTRANYQLLTDNILDASHADYLHALLDSDGGTRHEAPRVQELGDGSVEVSWTWGPASPMKFLSHMYAPGAEVHTRLAVRWHAPSAMHLRISSAAEGEELDQGLQAEAMHIMTPETARQTHYFYGGVRSFDVANDAYTAAFLEGARRAFADEDKPMIEAVQANMGDETDIFAMRPLGLIGDAGGVRVRERLRRLIAAERHP